MLHRTEIGRYPVGLNLSLFFFGIGVIIAFFHLIGNIPNRQIWLNSLSSRRLPLGGRFCKNIKGILSEPQLLLFLPSRPVFSSLIVIGSFRMSPKLWFLYMKGELLVSVSCLYFRKSEFKLALLLFE